MSNSNKTLSALVIFAILAGGIYFLTNKPTQNSPSMMKKDEVVISKEEVVIEDKDKGITKTEEVVIEKDGKMMEDKMDDSRYIEYSQSALDGAVSNRRVLFFYASWCPTCKTADTNLKSNLSKIPADVTVVRVNYNDPETDKEEKDLAKKYGISYQHTFVQIDGQGKEITKWNGGQIEELLLNTK